VKGKQKKPVGSAQRLFPVDGLIEHFREREIKRLPDRYVMTVGEDGILRGSRRTEVAGIPIPPDLALVCWREAESEAQHVKHVLTVDAGGWSNLEDLSLPVEDAHVQFFTETICDALEKGFRLALLRYAEDLKHVPEAAAILEANRRNAKKGGAARRKQAEPRRQEARRLDRELRKTVKKKYLRVQRIAAEMRVDTRTVERYLAPKK
jgi:hypothetical protein